MCAGLTDCVVGADNIDIELHSDVVPVHEYLPVADTAQRPVPTMDGPVAHRYAADYEAALDRIDDIDLILVHHATISAVAAHAVARRRHIPYIVFIHGTGIEPRHHGGFDDGVWGDVEKAVLGAAGLIVTTDYVRDELVLPLIDLPLDRFVVVPCGVDFDGPAPIDGEAIRAKYELPDRFVISPGALTHTKGPQNVVSASRFYSDLAPTVFIGDGDLREEMETALGDRGRMLGFVPHRDKDALIAAATVLAAAPVKQEHFGIIYVEALAAGTVPVAYGGGGVDTIVTPEVGILTERTPHQLGDAVRQVLVDDDRRRALEAAGRARAQQLFDNRTIGDRFVGWVEEIEAAGTG